MKLDNILIIAGSDPCGGAGLQADLKTAIRFGVYPATVVTAITAQSTKGVTDSSPVSADLVGRQMDALLSDLHFKSVKTGMLPTPETVDVVANALRVHRIRHLVLDPVIRSQSGYELISEDAISILKERLIPQATLITPNRMEAEVLSGIQIDTLDQAKEVCVSLFKMGAAGVVLKGGHAFYEDLRGPGGELIVRDIYYDGESFKFFDAPRIESHEVHGTGCSFATAIASCLAKGQSVEVSIRNAKRFISDAIFNDLTIGHGYRVVNQNFLERHEHGRR